MRLHFYKYQGTGNDFVMVDNRDLSFPKENRQFIETICHRRLGVGADGLILLENDEKYDFRMIYYNSDGRESSMCGNGGRCVVAFAKRLKIIEKQALFIATDGEHYAQIDANDHVRLQMKSVDSIEVNTDFIFLNTGSPHHVTMVDNVEEIDVKTEGAKIRYGNLYEKQGGTNVNFVTQLNEREFRVRTYERGVEDETYSCGTGATAVALSMYHIGKTQEKEIDLQTPGGTLKVLFERKKNGFDSIYLCGAATFVFEGNYVF